jgi:hypothetical protein
LACIILFICIYVRDHNITAEIFSTIVKISRIITSQFLLKRAVIVNVAAQFA